MSPATPQQSRSDPIFAAVLVAALAFTLYRATLLPGFDFGDTASFQAKVGLPAITPRDGYPLYFALGRAFLWLTGAAPAFALNLASAVAGAVACGVLVLVACELAGSLLAGVAAAVLFAGSYTFWSQAVIAEVYTLHLVFVATTLLVLLKWQARPSLTTLATFFALYALGFGNHLSMILLAPAYALFLLLSAPDGVRSMLRLRVLGLAAAFACLGALQYVWNLQALWYEPQPPAGLFDALVRFWFDVTKSDWRETMVLNVPRSMLVDHAYMYAFDLVQQFGRVVPWVAALGLAWLLRVDWRRSVLLLGMYLATMLFAYSYNVGDTHVFYLPSHLCVALLVAPGLKASGILLSTIRRKADRDMFWVAAVSLLVTGYAAARIYRDYPALDRSGDHRARALMAALTDGLDDRHAILLTNLNWQLQNGLAYFAKEVRPTVAYARTPDVLLYAPLLMRDNEAIGRHVAVTDRARKDLSTAYGPLMTAVRDPHSVTPTLADLVRDLPRGTRYGLAVLKPLREFPLDADDLAAAVGALSGGSLESLPAGDYQAMLGRVGERPALALGSNDPFQRALVLGDVPVEIRMESWLSADTIRRMGFGHLVAARQHTLIIERGVSVVAFDQSGRPLRTGYAAGIFAAEPRYLIRIRHQ